MGGVASIFAMSKSITLVETSMSEMNNCNFMLKHVYDRDGQEATW